MLVKLKQKKGITLIALLITIIVLLILAGVSVNLLMGENGILQHASTAGEKYGIEAEKEKLRLEILDIQTQILKETGKKATLKDLEARLNKEQYEIYLQDTVATTGKLSMENPTSALILKKGTNYVFTVDEKLVITKVETKEINISFSEATWENGKAKVEITSKVEGTIEYQKGSKDGSWTQGNIVTDIDNNTEIFVRVKVGSNYTTVESKLIKDRIAPTAFEIEVPEGKTTYNSTTVSLKTLSADNETGLKSGYTYVAEASAGNKIELQNIVETTKKIDGLTDNTTYKVYVIAYDNAGNSTKSNVVEVTTPEYTPPTPSTPVIGADTGEPRGGRDLDLGTVYDGVTYNLKWSDIAEIAKAISNTLVDSDTTNDITPDVSEFNITYDGTTYLLGVGDRMRIGTGSSAKKVRIMGFNHDDLVDTTVYGGTNTKAGISFEYVDFITSNSKMNSTAKDNGWWNGGGWDKTDLRATLNNEAEGSILAGVRNIVGTDTIKQVKKEYIKTYNNASETSLQTGENASKDYLWLLSCGEIWSNGYDGGNTRGYAITQEGKQYKYYKMINKTYNSNNDYTKKPTQGSADGTIWWLRSPSYDYTDRFCFVGYGGYCSYFDAYNTGGVAPGFCI